MEGSSMNAGQPLDKNIPTPLTEKEELEKFILDSGWHLVTIFDYLFEARFHALRKCRHDANFLYTINDVRRKIDQAMTWSRHAYFYLGHDPSDLVYPAEKLNELEKIYLLEDGSEVIPAEDRAIIQMNKENYSAQVESLIDITLCLHMANDTLSQLVSGIPEKLTMNGKYVAAYNSIWTNIVEGYGLVYEYSQSRYENTVFNPVIDFPVVGFL